MFVSSWKILLCLPSQMLTHHRQNQSSNSCLFLWTSFSPSNRSIMDIKKTLDGLYSISLSNRKIFTFPLDIQWITETPKTVGFKFFAYVWQWMKRWSIALNFLHIKHTLASLIFWLFKWQQVRILSFVVNWQMIITFGAAVCTTLPNFCNVIFIRILPTNRDV